MNAKTALKEKAVRLREEGRTYSEILSEVPVAKSTLSLWLREVGLSVPQIQNITAKRIEAQMRGAAARHVQRVKKQQDIYLKARNEIQELSERERWLMGIALYWAEGAKEKEWRPGSSVCFMNSDARMIKFTMRWFKEFCEVNDEDFSFSIHIHENSKNSIDLVKKHWSDCTGFPLNLFDKIFYKKHNIKTKRKNISDLYYGCLKVRVRASSTLLRQITGWIYGVCDLLV